MASGWYTKKRIYAIKSNLSDPNTTISIKETNENNPTLMNSATSNQMVMTNIFPQTGSHLLFSSVEQREQWRRCEHEPINEHDHEYWEHGDCQQQQRKKEEEEPRPLS